MKYIDMHCDTLMSFVDNDSFSLLENDKHVDLNKLIKGENMAQFFAIFFPEKNELLKYNLTDEEYFEKLYNNFISQVEKNKKNLNFIKNIDSIDSNRINAILSLEDCRIIDSKLENIKKMYDKGVRIMGLTWNSENCFGYPNSQDLEIMKKPLKKFGYEAIEYMNHLGIGIDVSHLSDGGFYSVVEHSKKPFFATHSNARFLNNHPRNLTDNMIKKIADKGGVIGLNFFYSFIAANIEKKHTEIDDIIRHAKHIVNVGGENVLGLGSDFDGISGTVEISEASKMQLLFEAMKKNGFTNSQIEKIAFKNVLRTLKDTIK